MASITVRDLPDSLMERIRMLSKRHRRSINSELLLLIEQALEQKETTSMAPTETITPEIQAELWLQLAGSWKDERSTAEIIDDIYSSRTKGRSVSL